MIFALYVSISLNLIPGEGGKREVGNQEGAVSGLKSLDGDTELGNTIPKPWHGMASLLKKLSFVNHTPFLVVVP